MENNELYDGEIFLDVVQLKEVMQLTDELFGGREILLGVLSQANDEVEAKIDVIETMNGDWVRKFRKVEWNGLDAKANDENYKVLCKDDDAHNDEKNEKEP